jgi:hypothetical protein
MTENRWSRIVIIALGVGVLALFMAHYGLGY